METPEQRDQDIRAVMRPAVHFFLCQLQASNDISDMRVMRVSLLFFFLLLIYFKTPNATRRSLKNPPCKPNPPNFRKSNNGFGVFAVLFLLFPPFTLAIALFPLCFFLSFLLLLLRYSLPRFSSLIWVLIYKKLLLLLCHDPVFFLFHVTAKSCCCISLWSLA